MIVVIEKPPGSTRRLFSFPQVSNRSLAGCDEGRPCLPHLSQPHGINTACVIPLSADHDIMALIRDQSLCLCKVLESPVFPILLLHIEVLELSLQGSSSFPRHFLLLLLLLECLRHYCSSNHLHKLILMNICLLCPNDGGLYLASTVGMCRNISAVLSLTR